MKRIQKIKEVCTISGGYAFKSNDFTRQGIPIIRIGDISGNKVKISSGTVFFEEYNEKLNKFIIEKGDILVALSGATTGKFGIYDEEIQALLNQRVAKISPKENINNKYLYHYMNKLQNIIYNKALGCAQPNISPNEIGEIEIYVPSRLEQDKISDVLDIAKDLIDKRKKQIEELDLLVKSKFIEMFGDPITNSKEWNTFELREGIKEIKYGTSKPPIFSEEGIPFVRATNIKFGRIIENDMKYISEYEAEKIEKCKLSLGDTIIVRSGANTGDNAFVSEEYVGSYGGYDIIVKLNEKINYIFLNALLNSIYRETIIQPLTRRAGQPHLNSEQIQSLVIYNPPIELQNQFADFVKQVDKLKFEMEKSLKELEDNFNSLMQKAFKGEILI
ncbi:restriction endonuclease subunit S [Clostridium perfringens]